MTKEKKMSTDISKQKDAVKEIGLDELIKKCNSFLNKEIKEENLKEWAKCIYLKKYLPINEKCLLINNILYTENYNDFESDFLITAQTEIKKFFNIALAYTNIKTEGFEDLITMQNLDIIMICFGDIFFTYFGTDYNRTVEMLNNTVNMFNMKQLIDYITDLDNTGKSNLPNDIKKTFKTIENNKETLDKLLDIVKFNKPIVEDK